MNTNTPAPVDVLTEIDIVLGRLVVIDPRAYAAMMQTRAAVAEQIEAHAGLLAMVDSGVTSLGAIRRSRAALAQVGGRS